DQAFYQDLWGTIASGRTWKGLLVNKRKDGALYTEHATISPVKDASGRILNYVAVKRDITEFLRAEEERAKLQEQLNQAQKMESVGRLAGGVAHDFNNMLGVILGHVEFALEKAEQGHELHADLKEIQTAAMRSAAITKQLLAFARKQTISPKKLDLNETVESMLNMLRRLIGEDIDLVWKPTAQLWPVKMDPSQIDQILANLCVNARDAIDSVGKLTIETGRKTFDEEYCKKHEGFIPGDFVLLAVSDNGCGMDKETLENLFEPFFTTKEVGKGTGLGLATIYGIVKQNNGFINVYSEPGQGSIFKIYLPRLVADEDTDKVVPEKKAAAGGSETILLVEDEPTILRMTRIMLERKGYSVLPAATPGEAIDLAKTHADKIHLLMTDVVMPEMNGRDLAGQIVHLYPDIRLLFMSGYTADVIAHQGVLDDGVAFIQKPFSMADMTEKVREVLDMA
uniref:ATP-binding protein n=1 Tax=Candidatus Electrothrix sp. TaxID=2170559 RepID=UPI0040575D1A